METGITTKQNQQLTDKQQQLSKAIAKVGNLSEVAFAKQTVQLTKIKELDEESLSSGLSYLFTKIPNLLGIKDPITSINKADIKEMILMRFKSLSLEEIDYAFKLERYSVYEQKTEHFQLFNAEYVGAVLNKFKKWLQKTRFVNNIPMTKISEPKEISENKKQLIIANGVINCFEYFKENNQIQAGTLYVYDVLYELKAFPIHSKKFKQKIQRKAIKNIYKEKENFKTSSERKSINEVIKEIQEGKNKVAAECKRIILRTFFKKVLKMNIPISKYLSRQNLKQNP